MKTEIHSSEETKTYPWFRNKHVIYKARTKTIRLIRKTKEWIKKSNIFANVIWYGLIPNHKFLGRKGKKKEEFRIRDGWKPMEGGGERRRTRKKRLYSWSPNLPPFIHIHKIIYCYIIDEETPNNTASNLYPTCTSITPRDSYQLLPSSQALIHDLEENKTNPSAFKVPWIR